MITRDRILAAGLGLALGAALGYLVRELRCDCEAVSHA